MIKSYRAKLLVSYLLIFSLLLILLGGIAYFIFKDRYLQSMEERLVKDAYLVVEMTNYRASNEDITRFYQDICDIAGQGSTRVTIIDREGKVLGDSGGRAATMDIHSSHPEVYTALQGETGIDIRYSETIKKNMLYVAVPLADGQVAGALRMAVPLAQLQDTYQQIVSVLFLAIVVCFLLALLFSFIIGRRFSRSLDAITEAVDDMSAGNLKRRLPHHYGGEMDELALAFNSLGEQIEKNITEVSTVKNRLEAILANTVNGIILIGNDDTITYSNPVAASLLDLQADYLERKYVETIHSYDLLEMIDEAEKRQQAVKRTLVLHTLGARIIEATVLPINNQATSSVDILLVLNDVTAFKRLEKMRKDFVANVSHELKTPVASISGFAETLIDEVGDNPENGKEFARIIYNESQRLANLISDLLELSKLESEAGNIELSITDINQTICESINRMKAFSDLKNIDITFTDNMANIGINTNAYLLDQVLTNLLDNAIKYTPDCGQIVVQLDDMGDKIKISIKDNGMGIPAKDMPRIFERFYRVDKARSSKTGGTGLGLSIVKHALDKLNGEVEVTSTEGSGTTFSFTLPK